MSERKDNIIVHWEPSYRMEPSKHERFLPQDVRRMIEEIMSQRLNGVEWNEAESLQVSKDLCQEVKDRVKEMNIPRYKLVLQAFIGEVKGQGAFIASRCLWDICTDNYASFSFKNTSLFCTLMVFGLYLE